MRQPFSLAILTVVFFADTHAMVMRNNALMSKMVSQFQDKGGNNQPKQQRKESEGNSGHVMSLMQNVLCRNFPSIPCDIIMKDDTLKNLIKKSIQQIKYKKMTLDSTTSAPNYQLTLFPVINSEDLSNFLQVSDTGYFHRKKEKKQKKQRKKSIKAKNYWSQEKRPKTKKKESEPKGKTAVFGSRKKIRKFYPHKIKYKDKGDKRDFADYSEEKLSISVETPENHGVAKRKHFSYRGDPSDPPIWRIDYMKHGEPSFNMFGYEADSLKGKIVKTGPNVIVDENVLEQAARKDVLHPDVYIKKNYVRKKTLDNSDGID